MPKATRSPALRGLEWLMCAVLPMIFSQRLLLRLESLTLAHNGVIFYRFT